MPLCPRGIPLYAIQHGYGNTYAAATPAFNGISYSEAALREHLRSLWEQHGIWTRLAIMSMVFSLPDETLVINRLLQNPKDFESALTPLYGEKTASKFADLLTSHLTIAAELGKAAKAGDSKKAASAEKRWYANADEIERQALEMADMMADGIVKQFPDKFM